MPKQIVRCGECGTLLVSEPCKACEMRQFPASGRSGDTDLPHAEINAFLMIELYGDEMERYLKIRRWKDAGLSVREIHARIRKQKT